MSHSVDVAKELLVITGYSRQSCLVTEVLVGLCHAYYRICVDDCGSTIKELIYSYNHTQPNNDEKISECIKNYVYNLGCNVLNSRKHDSQNSMHISGTQCIRSLIHIYHDFLTAIINYLQDKTIFHKSLKTAFRNILNANNVAVESLVAFTNDVLSTNSNIIIANLQNTLDNIILFYELVTNKDYFILNCKLRLISRLFANKSKSYESENLFLSKMKYTAGAYKSSFITQMTKILTDFYIQSRNVNHEFKQECMNPTLNVTICSDAWNLKQIEDKTQIPPYLASQLEIFQQWYGEQNNGRKITFDLEEGSAVMEVEFHSKNVKTLIVSPKQMIILSLFNDTEVWKFNDMLQKTNMKKDNLIYHLLCLVKADVLTRETMSGSANNNAVIHGEDTFRINEDFSDERDVIEINTQDTSCIKATLEELYRLRRHQIDAAIVRVMKRNRTLTNDNLVSQVKQELKAIFVPKGALIKKRVAKLVDLEYIERDDNNRAVYHYKA